MPSVRFVKASACGNDFLLVEGAAWQGDLVEATRRMCDRHDGVGADGVEWLYPSSTADLELRLINADGSPAEISGNGTRCVAAMVSADSGKDSITLQTGAGLKQCTLLSCHGEEYEFESAMGEAVVGPELKVRTGAGEVAGIPVSMGNPHFVWFVETFPQDWARKALEIQRNGYFKQGINIELVNIENKHCISVQFYERGAGETHSSGTGSCAAAVASIAVGQAESPVQVVAPGGVQTVRMENRDVFLRGPARIVCRGDFYL